MFGPNTTCKVKLDSINYSHRSPEFHKLYENTIKLLREKLNINKYYDILLLSGSGTLGLEAAISSVKGPIHVYDADICDIPDANTSTGKFDKRLRDLANKYNMGKHDVTQSKIKASCHLETSISCLNRSIRHYHPCIVDAVCSFPVYDLPKCASIVVFPSNKLLGSLSGIVIVLVHKDMWRRMYQFLDVSYLNLWLYKKYSEINELPFTAPIHIIKHLHDTLLTFDTYLLRQKIDNVCSILHTVIPDYAFIGERWCPVLTIQKSAIPEKIAKKYDLYVCAHGYQIFTYSEETHSYRRLAEDLCHHRLYKNNQKV